ncbi:uncharacterized protein JCM6883_004155 [Sporobolomyces salmoneus]|uniref:uncharacterized protein n=1 Tax=Sporobolomyces salmoneus TaxID=183962 RepID=UPI00317798A9
MSYKNPYAKPNNPYTGGSSSSSSQTPYVPSGGYPSPAVAGPVGYPGYVPVPPSASTLPVAGPSIPAGYGGYDANAAQQASIYTPDAGTSAGYRGATGVATAPQGRGKPRTTVLRKGGGEVWEDQSLLEWDPSHFRLFIGDLDPAISDDAFNAAFSGPRFPSFVKGKVIRDKYTNKGRGFGFVSYTDPEDFLKAWKEMNGKYVGTRPVSIKKATAGVQQVNIGSKKAKMLESKQPSKTGTTPYERANAEEAGHRAVAGDKGYGPQRSRKSYIRR